MLRNIIPALLFFCSSIAAQKYDAELINSETEISVVNNKLVKTVTEEIQINNRRGDKYGEIRIPYTSMNNIRITSGYVKNQFGKVVKKLDKQEIVTRSAISTFSFYEDNYVKEFTLRHNTYPYTIAYSYTIKSSEFLFVDYWLPVLDLEIPTKNATLKLEIENDYLIKYQANNIQDSIFKSYEGRVLYVWKSKYEDIIKHEHWAPGTLSELPYVAIVPIDFKYDEPGTFESWTTFGDWQMKLLEGQNILPETERTRLSELIKGVDSDKEKIRKLYHYLQDNTRYINISLETGGLKPHSASYVARNKYGDCKALSNYFKSVLQLAGIESYYTKVKAGEPIEPINKDFPSQQFNHIILNIPLKNDTIWLDCTSKGPFNYLGTFTQNREALVVKKNASEFVRIPALSIDEVNDTRSVNILYNDKYAEIYFSNNYRGEMFEIFKEFKNSVSEKYKERILSNYLIDGRFELKDYKIHDFGRDSVKIGFEYQAVSNQIYKNFGHDIVLSNIAFILPEIEKSDFRDQDLQIDFPVNMTDTIIYQIPTGYKVASIPEPVELNTEYGTYSFNAFLNENEIKIVKHVVIYSGYYPRSVYNNFFEFYQTIIKTENKPILILTKN